MIALDKSFISTLRIFFESSLDRPLVDKHSALSVSLTFEKKMHGRNVLQRTTVRSSGCARWESLAKMKIKRRFTFSVKLMLPPMSLWCRHTKGKDTVRETRDKNAFDNHMPHCHSPLKLRRLHNMNNLWKWQPMRLPGINTAIFPSSVSNFQSLSPWCTLSSLVLHSDRVKKH